MSTGQGIAIAGIWLGSAIASFAVGPLAIIIFPCAIVATIVACSE